MTVCANQGISLSCGGIACRLEFSNMAVLRRCRVQYQLPAFSRSHRLIFTYVTDVYGKLPRCSLASQPYSCFPHKAAGTISSLCLKLITGDSQMRTILLFGLRSHSNETKRPACVVKATRKKFPGLHSPWQKSKENFPGFL